MAVEAHTTVVFNNSRIIPVFIKLYIGLLAFLKVYLKNQRKCSLYKFSWIIIDFGKYKNVT